MTYLWMILGIWIITSLFLNNSEQCPIIVIVFLKKKGITCYEEMFS